jgi:hypothetical protein
VFDVTAMPPKQLTSVKQRDCVGWVSFSMDGRFAYSSTGEIIDAASKTIVATLTDENGRQVQSEKLLDLVIANGKVVRAGNQFGVGMKGSDPARHFLPVSREGVLKGVLPSIP